MNNSIAIIEDNGQNLADKLGFVRIEYLQEVTDQNIDEWVKQIFSKHPDIEKIIIPVRLGKDDGDYTGLKVGLHIRLTKELGEKRLIPIIFVSEQTRSEIIGSQIDNQVDNKGGKTSTLLFTPGVKLTGWFELTETAESFHKTISKEELKRQVLPKLLITNQREQGHQLANEWGVFRLAKFAGIDLKTITLPTDLYFKYQFSKTDLNVQPQGIKSIGLQSKGCNALLIDDYADKGWKEVIDYILKSHINPHSSKLDVLTTFEAADAYQDYESKDIVFLDLRLKPEEDRASETLPLEDLSGLKLLRKIKDINKGIQVIILTASNKAWNMKALIDAGADGYFIKESPEIPVSDDASKGNYESLVEAIKVAFERRYLRDAFKEIKTLNGELDAKVKSMALQKSFVEELKKYLNLGFSSFASKEAQFSFDSAFTYFFLGLELISKELIDEDNPTEINGDFFHEFRRTGSKLKFFSNGSKTGNDLKSKSRRVNYDQKFYNLLDVAGISSMNSVAFIGKRNDFFHPDTINRSQSVVIEKQDVMDAFKCLKELVHNL